MPQRSSSLLRKRRARLPRTSRWFRPSLEHLEARTLPSNSVYLGSNIGELVNGSYVEESLHLLTNRAGPPDGYHSNSNGGTAILLHYGSNDPILGVGFGLNMGGQWQVDNVPANGGTPMQFYVKYTDPADAGATAWVQYSAGLDASTDGYTDSPSVTATVVADGKTFFNETINDLASSNGPPGPPMGSITGTSDLFRVHVGDTIVPEFNFAGGASGFASPYIGFFNTDFELVLNIVPLAVTPQNLSFDPTGNLDATYTVAGHDLPVSTNATLYWASGDTLDTEISPITTIDVDPTVGSHSTTFPASLFADPPAGATTVLLVTDPNHLIDNNDNVLAVNLAPSLSPTDLHFDEDGGANFGYTVVGGAVPKDTAVDLYYSSSPSFSDAIGGPIAAGHQSVAAGTATGAYGPFHVDKSDLGTPPKGAQYLLAVSDPNNVLGNFSDSQNVQAVPLPPDIIVDSVSTADSRSVDVDYHIDFADVTSPLTIDIYCANAADLDDATQTKLLTSMTVDGTMGYHDDAPGDFPSATIQVPGGLQPNTSMPFVLAVVNKDQSIQETNYDNDSASFRTYVIGAVVPGFNTGGSPPPDDVTWVTTMANELRVIDGYYAVDAFNWPSGALCAKRLKTRAVPLRFGLRTRRLPFQT